MAPPAPRTPARRLLVRAAALPLPGSGLPARGAVLGLTAIVLVLASCTSPGATPAGSGAASAGPGTPGPGSTTGAASATPGRSSAPSSTGTPRGGSPTPSGSSASPCRQLVGRLSLPERVGQLLMVSVSSTELSASDAAMVGRTDAGSVLLLGNSRAGLTATQAVVADVRAAADRPERINVMVAADQEGGLVQRLAGRGFTDIPSARRQARLSDADLTTDAKLWGDALDRAGINLNLAPVADVVPRALVTVNEPIGRLSRGYGPSPAVVARKVTAFTSGMDDAGIATAVKHFPGLGRVRGNTDTQVDVIDSVTTRRDAGLKGFRAAVGTRVDMVMVSSATYTRIDPGHRAVFSPIVINTMIRGDLGFDGVVISDDLAAKGVSEMAGPQRAVRFLKAGGDLAIVADPDLAEANAKALVARAQRDPGFAARIDESAGRVLALKDRRGLVRC